MTGQRGEKSVNWSRRGGIVNETQVTEIASKCWR